MTRKKLSSRRHSVGGVVVHAGSRYVVNVGLSDEGEALEIFVQSERRRSSQTDDIARDFGLMMSLALQHGCPLETMRASLGDGSFAADVLAEVDGIMAEVTSRRG